jgi:hypothetical protein
MRRAVLVSGVGMVHDYPAAGRPRQAAPMRLRRHAPAGRSAGSPWQGGTKRGQANPPAGPRCGVLPGLHSSRIFAIPTIWGKKTVLVRVPIPVSVHRPHPNRPADLRDRGGQSTKVRLAGASLRLASGAPTPAAPHRRRAGRQRTGRVSREAAVPHGVTSERRILNPVLRSALLLRQPWSQRGRAGGSSIQAGFPNCYHDNELVSRRLARAREACRDLCPALRYRLGFAARYALMN